jgi:hypothetical protein
MTLTTRFLSVFPSRVAIAAVNGLITATLKRDLGGFTAIGTLEGLVLKTHWMTFSL